MSRETLSFKKVSRALLVNTSAAMGAASLFCGVAWIALIMIPMMGTGVVPLVWLGLALGTGGACLGVVARMLQAARSWLAMFTSLGGVLVCGGWLLVFRFLFGWIIA